MRTVAGKVLAEVEKAFIGKEDITRAVLLAMIAGGHILLEDVPGVGKTTLAMAFSKLFPWIIEGCSSRRMSCRPTS